MFIKYKNSRGAERLVNISEVAEVYAGAETDSGDSSIFIRFKGETHRQRIYNVDFEHLKKELAGAGAVLDLTPVEAL